MEKNDFWTDCTKIQFPVKCIFLRTLSSRVSHCGLVVLLYIIKFHDLEEECLDCDHSVEIYLRLRLSIAELSLESLRPGCSLTRICSINLKVQILLSYFSFILKSNTYQLFQENSSPLTRKHFSTPPRRLCVCGPSPLHHVFWPTEKFPI